MAACCHGGLADPLTERSARKPCGAVGRKRHAIKGRDGEGTSGLVYKVLPSRYVGDLLAGRVLFRNLVYFKRLEGDVRADANEGMHIDFPDTPVRIDNLTTGMVIEGRFALHNALKCPELVYCFCTSRRPAEKFGDACVEIGDPEAFQHLLQRALAKRNLLTKLEKPYVRAGSMVYFRPNAPHPPGLGVKNPTHLPFFKSADFEDEQEYRFVFARKGGFELLERFVTTDFDAAEDIAGKPESAVFVDVGPIFKIARQIW